MKQWAKAATKAVDTQEAPIVRPGFCSECGGDRFSHRYHMGQLIRSCRVCGAELAV